MLKGQKTKHSNKHKISKKKPIRRRIGGNDFMEYTVGEKKATHSGFGYDDTAIVRVAKNDIVIQGALRSGYFFEKNVTMQAAAFSKEGDVMLDVGTNIGCVTIPFSRMVGKTGSIHSFEPFPMTQKILEYNVKINKLTNVTIYKVAVGHTIMTTSLAGKINVITKTNNKKKESKKSGSKKKSKKEKIVKVRGTDHVMSNIDIETKDDINYGGVQLGKGGPIVNMITIDSLHFPRVDFLKVDIEGAEPLAFYGARETIVRCKPIIMFEYNWQKLTDDMIEGMNIPLHIQKFDYIKFCKENGYDRIVYAVTENFILIPKGRDRTIFDPKVNWELVNDIPELKDFDLSGFVLMNYIKPSWN